jgi:hypothetical protein
MQYFGIENAVFPYILSALFPEEGMVIFKMKGGVRNGRETRIVVRPEVPH